jgi:uncharacterized protein HemX
MNLRRLISIITTSALSLLASVHVAVAQEIQEHQQEVFRDYSQEALRLAREKVQAATSAGAFGHGVPIMNTGSDLAVMALILSAFAIGAGVLYYVLKKKSQNAVTKVITS